MRIEHHIYVDPQIVNILNSIAKSLAIISRREGYIAMTLNELKVQVEKNTAIEASAVALIQGMAAKIAEAANDPAAIQALADELSASAAPLAEAITANTQEADAAPAGDSAPSPAG